VRSASDEPRSHRNDRWDSTTSASRGRDRWSSRSTATSPQLDLDNYDVA